MAEGYSLRPCHLAPVPNLASLVGGSCLVRTARLACCRCCAWPVADRSLLVLLGGTLQSILKSLYTLGVGHLRQLSEAQFVSAALGCPFPLVGMLVFDRGDLRGAGVRGRPAVAALEAWKIPLLIVMTLCSFAAYGLLSWIAFRRGACLADVIIVVDLICLLSMGRMASGEQTVPCQWIEEGINSPGHIGLSLGWFSLYRTYIRNLAEVGYA